MKVLIFVMAFISGWLTHSLIHQCKLLTRCEAQEFLRKYDNTLKVDGEVGRLTNEAWQLYEDEELNKWWIDTYERGIK